MVLFCIGVVHLVIGVELTNAKIAIPWFPTVHFKHPEYLVYLYWGFNFYAIYRYTLHNNPLFRKCWFNSLYKGLHNPAGETFISETIWERGSSSPNIISRDDTSITIYGYNIEEDPSTPPGHYKQENVSFFTFDFAKNYKFKGVTCSVADQFHDIDEVKFNKPEVRDMWGLKSFLDEEGVEEFETKYIKSKLYRLKLFLLTIVPCIRLVFTTKANFDLTLPIVLNISLFIAWVLKVSFS